MLKKYTKYAVTAFAVASLSTFIIDCGADDEEPMPQGPADPQEGPTPGGDTNAASAGGDAPLDGGVTVD